MRIEEVRSIELAALPNDTYHRGVDALRAVFEEMEEFLLEELRRLTLPNGRPRFVGHGARPRRFITHLGTADLRPRRVHDRLHGHTFSPLLTALGLGKKRYTLELRLDAAERPPAPRSAMPRRRSNGRSGCGSPVARSGTFCRRSLPR